MRLPPDPDREERELRAYLGPAFDRARLERYHEQLEEELERVGDEQRLYRTSQAYLYNLTAFAMTGTKDPYLEELARAVSPPARVLDYGCGIGSVGMRLLEAGYRVAFADYANPSTRYLRWRLSHRGLKAPIYDLDEGGIPPGFDLAFAFDVIEHVEDPIAFLEQLEQLARLILVNLLEPLPGDTGLHHDLPMAELLTHAGERGLKRHVVHHGRSHLLLYEPGARSRRRALRSLRRGKPAPAPQREHG